MELLGETGEFTIRAENFCNPLAEMGRPIQQKITRQL